MPYDVVTPNDVTNNPLTSTVTVTFSPSRLSPVVEWQMKPPCADPDNITWSFTVTDSAGLVVFPSTGAAGPSCAFFGVPSSSISESLVSSPNLSSVSGVVGTPDNGGYWMMDLGGDQASFGNATYDAPVPPRTSEEVGVAEYSGTGYWWVGADGGVTPPGNAPSFGSMAGPALNAPMAGIAATPDRRGYWLVGADGGDFSFGDAAYGSIGGRPLNAPIVGIASSPDGHGYWLVAADGRVFSFGDSTFDGSMGSQPLAAPITGMAASAAGGYWMVGTDGGVFSFGGAPFLGSMGGQNLSRCRPWRPRLTAGVIGWREDAASLVSATPRSTGRGPAVCHQRPADKPTGPAKGSPPSPRRHIQPRVALRFRGVPATPAWGRLAAVSLPGRVRVLFSSVRAASVVI